MIQLPKIVFIREDVDARKEVMVLPDIGTTFLLLVRIVAFATTKASPEQSQPTTL